MFIKNLLFRVSFSHYAEKHFCKDFSKKYHRNWINTRQTILDVLTRAYEFQKKSLIDTLKFHQETDRGIFKLDFSIAGKNESPKTSGNRAIFAVCNNTQRIEILLVYHKNDCPKHETQWIFEQIKKNFPEYKKLCS
jgi:hypothetical protein